MKLLRLWVLVVLASGLSSCVLGTVFSPDCRSCVGRGRLDCPSCEWGKVACSNTGCVRGKGCAICRYTLSIPCTVCRGEGTKRCEACRGSGRVEKIEEKK